MADSLNLSTTALFVTATDDREVDIQNGGPGTVYYSTLNTVSSSSNDGSIAAGATLRSRAPKWIVSTTPTKVFIENVRHRDDTINVHGIADTSALSDASSDIAVIGEILNLDTTGVTDETATIQAAQDAVEAAGGGRLVLPGTGTSGFIRISDRIQIGHAVNIVGQGKRETVLKCYDDADAGLYFVGSSDPIYTGSTNRGGRSGGFQIQGNNVSTYPAIIRSTNRNFEDIRFSTPADNGAALKLNSAQNCNFFGIEAEDSSHTDTRSVTGILFDGAARGHNFFGGSINEFTNGHILVDATYEADPSIGSDYSTNLQFYGMLIERCDRFDRPIIWVKAGDQIHFHGGDISHGGGDAPTGDHYLVELDNSAARSFTTIGSGGAPTRGVTFSAVNFYATMNGSTRHATVFHTATELNNWTKALDVACDNSYTNCKYGFRIESGSTVVHAPNPDARVGGGFSDGPVHASSVGKPNTRIQSGSATLGARPTIDYYEISGNTNIDSISATYPGHQITLKFSGTPTISSSAGTIKLSGLSDMSVTADDILCLICDGTNWHETSRVVK